MLRTFTGSVLLAFLVPVLAPAQDGQIPIDLLLKLKAATVYVKAQIEPGIGATGSGFVFMVDGKTALIATNEHVVVPPNKQAANVQVVFDSGRKTERTYRAEILSTDALRDLAVLRVTGVENLPAPIAMDEKLQAVETMPIYALGFPFGDRLGTGGRNPAITIGKGSVSSLREDERGDLQAVQIDGDLNPGNSGGPVVDTRGRLVGVAVARIRGTQIGLAIPATELKRLLEGRIAEAGVRTIKATDGVAEVEVTVKFVDPLKKITRAGILIAPTESVRSPVLLQPDNTFPALPGARTVDLKVENQVARGTFTVKADGKSTQRVTIQPFFTDLAKNTRRVQPMTPHLVDFVRSATVNLPQGIEGAGKTEMIADLKVTSAQFGEGVGKNGLFWANDGKSFYYLDGAGSVFRISYPELKVEASLITEKKCSWLSASGQGPILTVEEPAEVWLLDPVTLTKSRTIRLPAKAQRVVAAPRSNTAYADEVQSGAAWLKVIDLTTGRIVNKYRHDDFDIRAINFVSMVVTEDGKYLFSRGGFGSVIYRFRLEGEKVFVEEASPSMIDGRFEGICLAGDGKYVAAPCWPGNSKLPEEATQRAHRTYLFNTSTFKAPALTLQHDGPPMAVAFDISRGYIYSHDHQKHLVIFDSKGAKVKAVRLDGKTNMTSVRQILVHPEGRKLLILNDGGVQPSKPTLYAVTLPVK